MNPRIWTTFAACVLCVTVHLFAGEDAAETKRPDGRTKGVSTKQRDDMKRVTVAAARERAALTHEIYVATLAVMHHRYFRDDDATIPARAMEDVFRDIEQRSNISARWVSVNTKAMSIDHEPKTAFEKKASRSLGRGKVMQMEIVEDGYYRHAGVIPLTSGCISCHVGFGANNKVARFSGLVISIPIRKD